MRVNLEWVASLSRAVALEHGRGVRIAEILSSEERSERVQLRFTLEGCHDSTCRISFDVARSDHASFARELTGKLHQALSAHNTRRT